jgi:hypothetical protein
LADVLLSELDFDDSAELVFDDSEEAAADLSLESLVLAAPSLEVESPEDSLLPFERA